MMCPSNFRKFPTFSMLSNQSTNIMAENVGKLLSINIFYAGVLKVTRAVPEKHN